MPLIKFFLLPILVFTGFGSTSEISNSVKSDSKMRISSSQEIFSFLRCHRQAKNIVVNWGMSSITGVNHFVVYHSEDDDFYAPIAETPAGADLKYTFKHESVFPGYHYYYIAAVMNAGPAINSVVDVVRIVSH